MPSGLFWHLEHPESPRLNWLLRTNGCGALGYYYQGSGLVKVVVADHECIKQLPAIKRCIPNGFLLVRAYEPWLVSDPWRVSPVEFFEKFSIQLHSVPGAWEAIDGMEGRNEANTYPGVDPYSVDTYKAIAGWEWLYAERVERERKKAVCLNLATGHPSRGDLAAPLVIRPNASVGAHWYYNPAHPTVADAHAIQRIREINPKSPIICTEFGYEPHLYSGEIRRVKTHWKTHWPTGKEYAEWAIERDRTFQSMFKPYWGSCWFTFNGGGDWGWIDPGQETIDALHGLGYRDMPKLTPWKDATMPPPKEPPKPGGVWNNLRHFKPGEFKHPGLIDPILLRFLDEWRHESGMAFYRTSDGRTPQENEEVGGRPRSLHLIHPALGVRAVDFIIKPWTQIGVDRVMAAYYRVRERWDPNTGWGVGIGGAKKPPHFHLEWHGASGNILFPE